MKPSLLYIDDEEENLRAFKSLYRKEFNVFTGSSGFKGLEILEKEDIGLIVTDQRMPGMTGIEFLSMAKIKYPKIKSIILTAYSDFEILKEAINTVGVYCFHNKPFEPESLEQIMHNAVSLYQLEIEKDIVDKEIRELNQNLELKVNERTEELHKQYDIIKKQNDEITDSIVYAKRIQKAILPPNRIIKEYLKDYFIFYKPKDVVAGDFYWIESKGNKVLFASGDCTGHGVPGALVSVICNNALNRSVREYGLTNPGEILDKTREIVIQEFGKSDEEVQDGMDIALCCWEGHNLQYAGANNPLWIIRNGEIIETKADKQPIGKFDNLHPYTTHSFELLKGDSIYIFSDGYVDQFGGPKGKKFKANAFRKLLLSIQNKSMNEQNLIIQDVFEKWKGEIEQLDDICIIGVKF